MSGPDRHFNYSPFGHQRPHPLDPPSSLRQFGSGSGRFFLSPTLRNLYSGASASRSNEVIVLSDSEDETPRRRQVQPQPQPSPQSIDLTRDPPSSSSTTKRNAPFYPPTTSSPYVRPEIPQVLRLDASSGLSSPNPAAPAANNSAAYLPNNLQSPSFIRNQRPSSQSGSIPGGLRQRPLVASVNEYHSPPQSGSRVVFRTFPTTTGHSIHDASAARPRTPTGGTTDVMGTKRAKSPPTLPKLTRSPSTAPGSSSACVNCNRVRLNCDGARPCGPCKQGGDRDCVYSTTKTTDSPQQAPATQGTSQSAMPHEVIHPAQPLQSAQGGSNTSTERTRSSQAVKPADLLQTMPHSRAPATTGRRSLIVKLKFLSTSDFAKIVSQHEGSSNDVQPSGSVVRADAIPNPRSSTARLEPKDVFCTTTSPRKTNSTTPLDEETPRVMHDISDLSSSEQSDPLLSDDSDTSDMPETGLLDIRIEAEVEKIEALVESAQKQLQAWQEMFVQAELRQATIDARTCHRPRLDPSAKDPFRAVMEQRRKSAAGAGGVKPGSEIAQAGHVHGHKPHERFHNKKLTAVRVPERPFYTEATLLPKYKSIGRISSSFLAPNYRTAKYRPYDAEDEVQDPDATEKYFELEQRFKNNYPSLKSQRDCQELVWLWKPWAKRIFSSLGIRNTDVLYFFTQDRFDPGRELVGYYDWSPESAKAWREEQMRRCRTCELADPESRCIHFSETFNKLPKPDDRSLAFAGLVAHAFHRVSGVSLWHVALGGLLQPRYEDPQAMTKTTPGLCVICFRHRCPDHGSYEDPIEDDHGTKEGAEELKAFINDEEQDHNLRKFMALPIRNKHDDHHHHATAATKHVCGVFCVDPSQTLPNLIGRQSNGDVAGDSRAAAASQPTRNILADDEFCSTSCFWDVSRRRDIKVSEVKFQPFMSQSQKLLVDRLIGFYLNNKRGPCLISRIIKDVSCVMVFQYMVYRIAQYPHPAADSGATSDSSTHRHHQGHMRKKNKKALQPLVDVSRSAELDQRPPFVPCSHDGPCHNNPACSCFKSKVHCERFCGCDQSCKRRFRGCTCTMRGNKVCFKDSRCECWKLNRECDPALCGRCGVVDVLDSANKYNDEIRRGRCRNNRIQLGLPAPTSKAPSQVQGYGLYSRADIASGEFIGEYTGEIVSISEGDRRGAMYHVLNQEYLFVINKSQEIDASNNGNKMRFMNNSQREENINVEPKKLLCSGVVRVGLFAKRSIKAGEELLYNYNYPEEVVRNFWEPGERPSGERRLIPVGPDHIARTTGTNKLADEMVNEAQESSQSPLSRPPKRKRSGVESDFTARGLQEAYIAYQRQRHRVAAKYGCEDESDGSIYDLPTAPEIDDSQDSDYDTNGQGHQSEESNLGEYSEDESDQEAFEVPSARPRRSSHRQSLGGGGRSSERGESTRKGSATSRSRDRRGPQPGSHSKGTRTTSPGGARKGSQLAAVKRKRKIGPHDRRLGGRAQQQAWRTRRLKESLGISVSPNPASKSRDN